MKKNILLLIILTLPSFSFSQRMIYGDDNRLDYYAMPKDIQNLADSVVSLWENSSVNFSTNTNTYNLKTINFGERLNLCPEERFREQTIGAFCSGALISEDTIITAGHCITDQNKCDDTKIVFGYKIGNPNSQSNTSFSDKNVYSCKEIIKRHIGPEPSPTNPQGEGLGPDYAIIKLDRKVEGKTPLKMDLNQNINNNDSIFVIGYPVGLPIKLANDATVRDFSPEGYFVTNLDTYGGNSGSPVFNSKTNLIEGLLVRGDTDFEPTPVGCTISYRTDQNSGRGEDVTKISVLIPFLNLENKSISYDMDTSKIKNDSLSNIPIKNLNISF